VLAVLAIACFPGLAQAEENSGIQYESDVPAVPNDQGSNIPSKHKSGGTDAPSESESEASKSDTPGAAVPGGSDNSGGGGGTPSGQSNQAGGGDGQKAKDGSQNASGHINAAQPLATTPAAETDSDSGSSPLVPILIAIAVLAAISVGYFLYRQRRQQGPGSTVSSPKAG
jgi:cobalamin biosynthesis Mg chelatase CobN